MLTMSAPARNGAQATGRRSPGSPDDMWSEFSTGSDTDVEDRREFWGETDNTTESNESAGDSDDREEWTGGYWDGGEQPWDLGGMGGASIVGSEFQKKLGKRRRPCESTDGRGHQRCCQPA